MKWMALILWAESWALAQTTVKQVGFDENWVKADTAIGIELDNWGSDQQVAVVVGKTDLSACFIRSGQRLVFQPSPFRLPAGSSQLVVYLVDGGAWTELARYPLNVLHRGGLRESQWSPQLNLSVTNQFDEGHSGSALVQREKYTELAGQAGLTTIHQRGDWRLETSLNLVGSSYRPQALQFFSEGENAAKVDLSDYLLRLSHGGTRIEIGHVSVGNHRHLMQYFSSRGIALQHQWKRLSVSASSVSGSSLVGFDDFLGQRERMHRIQSAGLALDLLKRPGGMRLELMAMDGSVRPQAGFDFGQVVDAEESDGVAVKISMASPAQRVRAEVDFARSRFNNPLDPTRDGDLEVVAVERTTNDAHYAEVAVDLVRNLSVKENHHAGLTFTASRERVDPLYKSLGVFSNSDRLVHRGSLNGTLGALALTLSARTSEDNLDRITSILTTKTRVGELQGFFPVRDMFASGHGWVPNLNISLSRTHQYGVGLPVNGGFSETHVPDQLSENLNLGFDWSMPKWSLSYQASLADQDNRQIGRESADFENDNHQVFLNLMPRQGIQVGINYARARAANVELDSAETSSNIGFNANIQAFQYWTLSSSYQDNQTDDPFAGAEQSSFSTQTQISFKLQRSAYSGQLYVRHALQENSTINQLFDLDDQARTWTLTAGFNLSLQ